MTCLLKNGQYSYEVQKGLLGKGSFGSVYKGLIVKTNDIVAIKAMSLALIKKYGPDIKEIIKNEVAVLKDLSNKMYTKPCPFIIRIYDCFLTENNIYLVLEFCGEGDLSGILNKRKRLPEKQGLEVIYHIVRALDFLNQNGVCHRDLKPQNIFVTRNKNSGALLYKVGDFGFAVNSARNEQQVGTYPYMSPELLRGEEYGSEVDVWALGVIAHQILFGESYFIGRNQSEVKNNVLNKQYVIKEKGTISPEMADFLYCCLKKDKKQRIHTENLRKHPVFRLIEEQYEQMQQQQQALKHKDSAQQVQISTRLQNQLNKALFLQQLGRNLYMIQRMNLISIYLIKSCLYRLFRLKTALTQRQNIYNASPSAWQHVNSSSWFDNFLKYCQYMFSCCNSLFQSETIVFMSAISKLEEGQRQLLMSNLGNTVEQPPNQQALAMDLMRWATMLLAKPDNQSRLLASECVLAIKVDQVKYEFGKHMKERAGMDANVLMNVIKGLEMGP